MKILVVAPKMPYPLHEGAHIRIFNLIKLLAHKHEIILTAIANPLGINLSDSPLSNYCRTVVCLEANRPRSLRVAQLLMSPLRREPYLATLNHSMRVRRWLAPFVRWADAVQFEFPYTFLQASHPSPRLRVIDAHNIESQLLRLECRHATNAARKCFAYFQYHKMLQLEARVYPRADLVLATSERDRRRLQVYNKQTVVVPNGVSAPRCVVSLKGHTVLFSGLMSYEANSDAVLFFLREIWPIIKARIPVAKFIVAGKCPSRRLLAFAAEDILVTGEVRDMTPYFSRSSVFVAPLRIGSGTRIKILDAMACGLPVVSSTLGAQGLEFAHAKEILIEDHPLRFAQAVITLLQLPHERRQIGQRGRDAAIARYSWQCIKPSLMEIYAR